MPGVRTLGVGVAVGPPVPVVGVTVGVLVTTEVVGEGVLVGRGVPGVEVRLGVRVAVAYPMHQGFPVWLTHSVAEAGLAQQSASLTHEKNAKSVSITQNFPVETQVELVH